MWPNLQFPVDLATFTVEILNGKVHFLCSDTKSISPTFKIFYANLKWNPKPSNRYTINFVSDNYEKRALPENFKLDSTTEDCLFQLLKSAEVTKTAEIDQSLATFLEDGSRILTKPISELCNFSMTLDSFPDSCKMAKVKALFKKDSKTDLSASKVFETVVPDQTKEFNDKTLNGFDDV